jgi:polyphosphate kinase
VDRPATTRLDVRPVLRQVRSQETERFLDTCFREDILPLLTPIALDRGHPLPTLRDGARGLAVRFRGTKAARYGVILVHWALPAFVEVPGSERVPMEHVIAGRVAALFGRSSIDSCWIFRVVPEGSRAGDAHDEVAEFLAAALERTHRRRAEPFAFAG